MDLSDSMENISYIEMQFFTNVHFPSLVQFVCKDVHQYLRVTVGVDIPQIFLYNCFLSSSTVVALWASEIP